MDQDKELADFLKLEGIQNQVVLEALASVKRSNFVTEDMQSRAYVDTALPIHCGQTISQPFIVARMTELLLNGRHHLNKVLEIGTGSGYQAAILAQLCDEVYTIERIETLYKESTKKLADYPNVHTIYSDGNLGDKEHAPFDGIIVTAAAPNIPPALLEQLNPKHGVLVIPVRRTNDYQQLLQIIRIDDRYEQNDLDLVAFVPLRAGKESGSST